MDDLGLRTVRLEYPHPNDRNRGFVRIARHHEGETWLSMLEQILSVDFKDYSVEVSHEVTNMITRVTIVFDSIEDATLFKLQHGR